MYVRHRLDASLGDVLFGAAACAGVWGRDGLVARALASCGAGRDGLVCLSVRTGWDLWLGASGLGEGDEVLASAITHPEMGRIARLRGLRVVPVDLDPATLAPGVGALEASVSARTRVVLVAHLFGGRLDLGPVSRFCGEHGLSLVEDCAQAFAGPGEVGHPEADVSMYSFGTLKTATAFGGAVLRVRDGEVLGRMREIEADYPVQTRREYAGRLLKGILLLGASRPGVYGFLIRACARLGLDLDGLVDVATKSHAVGVPDGELLRRIRRRPCAPLISLLLRRLRRFDRGRLAARTAAGERLSDALGPYVMRPGSGSLGRTHWIFPVVVHDPDELVEGLRRRGFDASRATSSIVALSPPDGAPEPFEAARMMAGIVFLPAPIGLPEKEMGRLASVVNGLAVPRRDAGRLLA
ncbi:DegT/DnrJ/EryC1/StrS family aminotransferase [Rubrobacter tropicus]|uniref:DegT/DnrJ/EryC1/StrS family aminotransferase n=1 Tax=Rubrobacter tropicus TaxID=2653851 RepID=UPI00140CEEF2|nr:DegT/DnrJ/EryC1/StrS family aminotransferase [Rubrobacter tropicus]